METRARFRGDAGFSLMEVIVAMALFTVLAAVALTLILRSTQLSSTNNRRVAASNLATLQIESIRGTNAVDIPDGLQTRTEAVGNVTYTIKQTSNYVASESGASVCTGTGTSLSYKLVSVTVTWPNMGTTKPVRADTLRTLGTLAGQGLDTTKGAVALAVKGSTGTPVSGIVVTLSPGGRSVTTGEDGCAVFTGLTVGTYSATADTVGYVGKDNTQAATATSLGVTAGGVARGVLSYDTTRTVTLTAGGPSGFLLPLSPPVPLTFRNSYLSDRSYPTCTLAATGCVTGFPGTANYLFPERYDVWTGSCADSRTTTIFDAQPAASNGMSVAVAMGSALVNVTVAGLPATGRAVYAVHATEAAAPAGSVSCTTGVTYVLPLTVAGATRVLLPYGTYTFSLTPVPLVGAPTTTLTSSGTVTVNLTSAT